MSTSCRLPDTVVPVKYSIRYDDLDFDRCTFMGQVDIDCQVRFEVPGILAVRLHVYSCQH